MRGVIAIVVLGTALLAWLKGAGHLDISWWLVFAPIWVPVGLGVVAAIIIIVAVMRLDR